MTDDQLRSLVRDAVARHLGRAAAPGPVVPVVRPPASAADNAPVPPASLWQQHPSHHLYVSLVNVDGACVIEPSVACTHCGFCKSHGH